ncbi:MAG: hypothetical protein RL456_1954 [Pseudomonadota bacterium]|jgi:hypothetical protein
MSNPSVTYTVVEAREGRALILRDEGEGHAGHFECPTEFLSAQAVVGEPMPALVDPRFVPLATEADMTTIESIGNASTIGSEFFSKVCAPTLMSLQQQMAAADPVRGPQDGIAVWAAFVAEAIMTMTAQASPAAVLCLMEGMTAIARQAAAAPEAKPH